VAGVVDRIPRGPDHRSPSQIEFLALSKRPELADYDLVIPSLPGYGWSEAPKVSGLDTVAAAQMFVHLMTESLSYKRWVPCV
jgi:hypothetical protein